VADAGSYIRLQTCGVGALLRYDDLTEHEEKRFEEGLKGRQSSHSQDDCDRRLAV